jgi:hypothetical protein
MFDRIDRYVITPAMKVAGVFMLLFIAVLFAVHWRDVLTFLFVVSSCLFFVWLFWNMLAAPMNLRYVSLKRSLRYSSVLLSVVTVVGVIVGLFVLFPVFMCLCLVFGLFVYCIRTW